MVYQKLGHFSQKSNTDNLTDLLSETYKSVRFLHFEAGCLSGMGISLQVNNQL